MKAAPEGVMMRELKPDNAEQIAFYREHIAEFGRLADELYPRSSEFSIHELSAILKNNEAAEIIRAVVRMGNYTDHNALILFNMEVSKLLRVNHGIRLPRGKRPRPGMVKLVSQITPILLFYGLPCRTSESSRLVLALQCIASEINLEGDPRDELRRLKKIQTRQTNDLKASIYGAIARGLIPKKLTDAN
jgi:hypothetical protein